MCERNESKKDKISGITMIALAVTILMLITLAAISINIMLRSGMLEKTVGSREMFENNQSTAKQEITGLLDDMRDPFPYDPDDPDGSDILYEESVDEENCIGYYADLDGDEKADGIIYADLAIGQEQEIKWNNDSNGVFQYSKVTQGLKKYVKEEYEGEGFGDYRAPMVKEIEGGGETDRFYVMALNDFDDKTHTWYSNVYRKTRW